jgi:hypothetical protein
MYPMNPDLAYGLSRAADRLRRAERIRRAEAPRHTDATQHDAVATPIAVCVDPCTHERLESASTVQAA